MISVAEARAIVLNETPPPVEERRRLAEAARLILSKDIIAPRPLPLFTNSAMDGYAVRATDLGEGRKEGLPVDGVIGAGDDPAPLPPGHAIKIMTGAKLPQGADTVIPTEQVLEEGGQVTFLDQLPQGANVRWQGEEVREGERILQSGTVLSPPAIGLLAAVGLNAVPVFRPPSIALVATGSELTELSAAAGGARGPFWTVACDADKRDPKRQDPLLHEAVGGTQIFDSNTPALASALSELPVRLAATRILPDDPTTLRSELGPLIEEADILITTGGVSVGDYDYTHQALEGLGVQPLFKRVAQKPGKPFYFGRKGRTLVFGLPGNPVSALVCFYEYIRPTLRRLLGETDGLPDESVARLAAPIAKKAGLTQFFVSSASWRGTQLWVEPSQQGSHRIWSLTLANCLAVIPSSVTEMTTGDEVIIHWFPYSRRCP